MRLLLALLVCSVLAFPVPALAQTPTAPEKQALDAATAWLALIDAGRFAESWREAAPLFRQAMTEQNWSKTLAALRTPLGAVQSRVAQTAKPATQLPGVPDGHYLVMTFATDFAQKKQAVETVTFQQQTDGTWRAAGYYIR